MVQAKKDENGIPVLMGVSNADGVTPIMVYVDPVTHRLLVDLAGGSGTVTSVAALTLGTTGTDLSSSVANGTTTPVITLNVPTASATNRGALSSTDWSTFNSKAAALSGTINQIAYFDSATTIASLTVATYPSLTELSYVKGVTSAIQTQLGLKAPLASPTFTGTVTVPTPTNDTDAATKAYVDATAQGLSIKDSCALATTAALPTNTYANGASGVGATLTAVATGTLTVDGTVVALNDRVLVKDEAAPANNGIYKCTLAGAVGVAYILTRAVNCDQAAEIPGAFTFVEGGTTNTGAGFVVASAGPFTMGTTAITWTQFSGAGQITAGAGMTKTGNTLDVVGTADRLVINANSIDIAATYVGQTSITTLGTIATGVWNGTIITSAYGGTGNGFTKFSGPTTSEKTFTLPNVSATVHTSGAANNFGAFTAYFTETDNGNSSTADTIDWALSNKQKSTLTGNCTFTFGAPAGPCSLILKLVQDATGSRTVTWPAAVHWSGGTAPTLTTTANKVDIISFYYDGTTYFGNSTLNFTA